jgi:hypothetical protein
MQAFRGGGSGGGGASLIVPGRPSIPLGERSYGIPGTNLYAIPTGSPTEDLDIYTPWSTQHAAVLDTLALEVVALVAGSFIRCGLFAADVDFQPIGEPLFDVILDSASNGIKTSALADIEIPAGNYCSVVNADGGSPTVRVFSSGSGNNTVRSGLASFGSAAVVRMSRARVYAPFVADPPNWTNYLASSTMGYTHLFLFGFDYA